MSDNIEMFAEEVCFLATVYFPMVDLLSFSSTLVTATTIYIKMKEAIYEISILEFYVCSQF